MARNAELFKEILGDIREGTAVDVDLTKCHLGPEGAKKLASALEGNRSVTKLRTWGDDDSCTYIQDEGVVALARVLQGTSLTCLHLGKQDLGVDGMRALAEGLRQSSLKELDVSFNKFGHQGLQPLLDILPETTLTCLDLLCTDIGDEGLRAIAEVLNKTGLTSLGIGWTGITAQGLAAVAAVLEGSPLSRLDVSDNSLGVEGAKIIAQLVKGSQISSLNVSSCEMRDEGVMDLARALPGTCLTHLNIGTNQFGVRGMQALTEGLRRSSVTDLDVSFNKFGDEGLQALVDVMIATAATALTSLDLTSTDITSSGLAVLAAGMQGVPVSSLTLADELGVEGAVIMAQLLKGRQISSLCMRVCHLGDFGSEVLATALRQSSLTLLDLSHNEIGPVGMMALAEGLQYSQVKSLSLESAQGTSALAPVLKRTVLTKLDLSECKGVDLALFAGAVKSSALFELLHSVHDSPHTAALEAALWANRKNAKLVSEPFLLQMDSQGNELTFRTLSGTVAALLVWDLSRNTMDLPEAFLEAMDPHILPLGVQLRAPNLRFIRPDGALLDYDAPLAAQVAASADAAVT